MYTKFEKKIENVTMMLLFALHRFLKLQVLNNLETRFFLLSRLNLSQIRREAKKIVIKKELNIQTYAKCSLII